MQCEQCGRPIRNAEMWQLGGNRNAPTSRSMRQLCWDCREQAERQADDTSREQTERRERAESAPLGAEVETIRAVNF